MNTTTLTKSRNAGVVYYRGTINEVSEAITNSRTRAHMLIVRDPLFPASHVNVYLSGPLPNGVAAAGKIFVGNGWRKAVKALAEA